MSTPRLAVLVSGGGSNLKALLEQQQAGNLEAEIIFVAADRDCGAKQHAQTYQLPFLQTTKNNFEAEFLAVINQLDQKVDAIVLAGFLGILSADFCQRWQGKIINLHPSLLPAYGGKGMWGHHVHKAVLADKQSISGATVHFVTPVIDGGDILLQQQCPVHADDTPQTLAARVNQVEHTLLPRAVNLLAQRIQQTHSQTPEKSDEAATR
jgi:phosphoribosylglycinamide formyltransferase-1